MGLHLFEFEMEVEIIEYSNPGHFTLVDSVARIFSSKDSNKVNLCVKEHHVDNAQKLITRLNRSNLSFKLHSFEKVSTSLKIIITPEHELDYLLKCTAFGQTWMFVHNIDDWFELSLKRGLRQASDALFGDKNPKLAYFLLKRTLRDNGLKRKVVAQVLQDSNSYFVVINQTLKEELSRIVPAAKIKVIPFSVYDDKLPDLSDSNVRIRIAIPGLLSQKRRDYISVFKAMETWPKDLLSQIEIDLLGGISQATGERSAEVVEYAKKLIQQGYPIILRNNRYIELDEFDVELSKADIILGNLNIDQGGGSKYGKTKESGIPFTMIRAAKPGILPEGYSTLEEVKSSTLYFSNYKMLSSVFESISENNELYKLKTNAHLNSRHFIDNKLLNLLWE